MVMKYIKKPIAIEAIQLLPTFKSIKECQEFITQSWICNPEHSKKRHEDWMQNLIDKGEGLRLKTMESDNETQIISFGDFIIKGIKGEFYPCKPDIFELTYEKVD